VSAKFIAMTPELYAYVTRLYVPADPLLQRLVEETERLGSHARMQVAPDEGLLLQLLARSIGARSAIEIGSFTGYSAISIARGLTEDGKLLCCDVNEEWATIARRYFREAGLERKIELRIAPAIETLRSLPQTESLDFAFIDADKTSYVDYYEEILKRLRRGGLVLVDNVLWNGAVVDENDRSESTLAIRSMNEHVAADGRVDSMIVPIADGLTIARKR
jgi:caffeoyl-CoA O-methyltransferase